MASEEIPAALAVASAAVVAAEPGSEHWARAVDELAEEFVAVGDRDRAIEARRLGAAGLPEELRTTLGAALLTNLGADLMARYEDRGEISDLREAVVLAELVLGAAEGSDRLVAAVNLAVCHILLARRPGESETRPPALHALADELAIAGPDHSLREVAVAVLASGHVEAWQQDADLELLNRGVLAVTAACPEGGGIEVAQLLMKFAEATSSGSHLDSAERRARAALSDAPAHDRSSLHRLLALVLLARHGSGSDPSVLPEALAESEAAVLAAEESGVRNQVANALSVRAAARAETVRRGGRSATLDGAIDDARAVLEVMGRDNAVAEYINHLGLLLSERFDLVGDSRDLKESIELVDEALESGPPVGDFVVIATNQATSLLSRYELDGVDADLDRGIELIERAIAATNEESAGLAARHHTAGHLLAARAHHRGGQDDWVAADEHAAAAVRFAGESSDRANYLNSWGLVATELWRRTGELQDLDRAIEYFQEASEVIAASSATDLERLGLVPAIVKFNLGCRLADRFDVGLTSGHEDLVLLQRAADLLDDAVAAEYPHLTVEAGRRLGDIARRAQLWSEGEHAFRLALEAAGELAVLRPSRPDKERARSGVQGLGALAALCAVRAGDAAAAAVHLEQASATLIAEAVGALQETATFQGIVESASLMGRHVLLLGVTNGEGVAVLVGPDGSTRHTELPELTESGVAARLDEFRKVVDETSAVGDDPVGHRRDAADVLSAWTVGVLLSRITPLLGHVERLAVLPLGSLAWLPITTAGRPGEVALLSHLEPLLLIRATITRKSAVRAEGPARVVVWADSGPPDRLIPGVVREALRVARRHPSAEVWIDGGETTTGAGPADLLMADIAHLACHCDVDVDQPMRTVLRLDPPIRVGEDLVRSEDARAHVVLSACDAARTGATLPDEALSAATAFLLAGAGAVTAPLWPVADGAAPAFMSEYHALLAQGVAPARALTEVQRRWAASRPRFVFGPWVVTAWPAA
ncbi:CHAT domain-containing protein [Lentzea alba]|uniref:CHAT domain-containing protein n=1 Tax=Lentzea alba TaxID=2714351 RepID=UPI0039BFA00A